MRTLTELKTESSLQEIPKYKTNLFKMSVERKEQKFKTNKELQAKLIKERDKTS